MKMVNIALEFKLIEGRYRTFSYGIKAQRLHRTNQQFSDDTAHRVKIHGSYRTNLKSMDHVILGVGLRGPCAPLTSKR